MTWIPTGESGSLIHKILDRAREDSLVSFTHARKRIEAEQAQRGVFGGPVVKRCVDQAGAAVQQFTATAVPQIIAVLQRTGGLSRDSTAWLRQTIEQSVDAMVSGLGNQIDSLRTTGNFRGATDLLRPLGEQAKRNSDIEIHHVELGLGPPQPSEPTMISKGSPDLSKHVFEVALSFPGEVRAYVEAVDRYLTETVGLDACFYDKRYPAQLARPSLDTFLQDIYRRSKFIVAFICADYDKKEWCDVEFRVIRDIIKSRAVERVMYVRMDHAPVAGVMSIDGYVDGREYDPAQIAAMVWERIRLLSNAGPQGGSTFLVDQDRIEGPPSAGDKENAIGNGLDELHNEATRVRLSWARDNVTEVRFHNDTDDYTHEVRIEVTSLERQLQSGNWFVADVIGATLPLQLGHGGITIRPEKTWGFSFLKQSMAARITFSCAAERNGMGEFSLKERGRYRVRFTASWSGGQRAFEGVFNWTKDRPPLVEGMMSPVSAAPD